MNIIASSRRRISLAKSHRWSRISAAAAFCATATVASLGLTASAASAATVITWPVACTANTGFYGRGLTLSMNAQPVGTTIEADLYKYVPTTGQWVYQNAYDWARVGSGGYWQKPNQAVNNQIQLLGWKSGSYALYIYQWNAQNVLSYYGWSNSCYFAS